MSLCFKCKHFDELTWKNPKIDDRILKGLLACDANGIANENTIYCEWFERRNKE